jgi:hypothetical protein
MFSLRKGAQKSQKEDLKCVRTLKPNEVGKFIESIELVSKESQQIYRANHGGGMPCPDSVYSTPGLLDLF